MDGWELKELKEYPGRAYYYKKLTHTSTWIRPHPYPGLQIEWPPLISVMHILIKHKDSTENDTPKNKHANLTKEEAKQKIDDIFLNITKGAKFEEIAEKESDLLPHYKSSNIGWISRETLDKDFEDVAWSLDIGELSRPIDTKYGWQIILRNG